MSEWSTTPAPSKVIVTVDGIGRMTEAQLREGITFEREHGRAFSKLAETYRAELARRTGRAS